MSIWWEKAAANEFWRLYGVNPYQNSDYYDLFRVENAEYLKSYQAGLDMGLSPGEARLNALKHR